MKVLIWAAAGSCGARLDRAGKRDSEQFPGAVTEGWVCICGFLRHLNLTGWGTGENASTGEAG